MSNYIKKKFSYEDSPKTDKAWIESSEDYRKELISKVLINNKKFDGFEIIRAESNGNVILKTEKSIQASIRGILLLDLEQNLKDKVDQGITIWLEPVGDKSKLRNLRGIEIKSEINQL